MNHNSMLYCILITLNNFSLVDAMNKNKHNLDTIYLVKKIHENNVAILETLQENDSNDSEEKTNLQQRIIAELSLLEILNQEAPSQEKVIYEILFVKGGHKLYEQLYQAKKISDASYLQQIHLLGELSLMQ